MDKLVRLNLPQADLKINKKGETTFIRDSIRNKWLVLTPEEWVRQNFICYMITHCGIDRMLIKQEHTVPHNGVIRRADIVVFNSSAEPMIVVECKRTDIELDQNVVTQVGYYNMIIGAPYLIVTNGLKHIICKVDRQTGSFSLMSEFPKI